MPRATRSAPVNGSAARACRRESDRPRPARVVGRGAGLRRGRASARRCAPAAPRSNSSDAQIAERRRRSAGRADASRRARGGGEPLAFGVGEPQPFAQPLRVLARSHRERRQPQQRVGRAAARGLDRRSARRSRAGIAERRRTAAPSSPASRHCGDDRRRARRAARSFSISARTRSRRERRAGPPRSAIAARKALGVERAVAEARRKAKEAQDAQEILADALARASPMKRTRRRREIGEAADVVVHEAVAASSESALIVKSRRRASSAKSRPKRTLARRPSVSTSWRSVVVSIGRPSTISVTVPCATPVGATPKPAAFARAHHDLRASRSWRDRNRRAAGRAADRAPRRRRAAPPRRRR